MYTTSFSLLMLVLTPWLASGRPAEESVQTSSRDSRQLLLPYYVPVHQPSFQDYGNPLGALTPEAKLQLLQRLLATSAAMSTANRPSEQSGFKTSPSQKNSNTTADSIIQKQESEAEVLAALGIRNTGLTPEVLKQQVEGRPDVQSIVNMIVQSVTTALIEAIMNQFFG
ncbi:uncharacterized protein LOC130689225 [Daphnia carinata]|uniref:uncharacterized protein LOC130689225 n=1 Tax=Daphnia carinata TaxID=120202 RepID=UPI002580C69E|nr:uncharacterized protein LOC130689225 [Daphnia carinata]